jgi:predicted phosphodiesterase
VLHDLSELDLDPIAAGFHVVVSGHSHKPARSQPSGTLFINPGSAGPKRFQLPTTIARLDLAASPWRLDFVDILGGGRLLSPAEIRGD